MFSTKKSPSSYSRSARSLPRSPRRPKIQWSRQSPTNPSSRRGDGVRYGSLNLTPSDHHNHHSAPQPNPTQPKLKIAVLGGNEEVGKNMTLLEYGEDIILIDMGIQFAEEHMLGVDGCVPDLTYLRGKEHRVRAVIITHMHNDHIAGIPHLMPSLPNVPIFSAPLTLAMIAKKLEYTPDLKIDLRSVDEHSVLQLGSFAVSFMSVSHSVPAAMGVVIDTPVGRIVHTGDFKIDIHPQTEDEKRAYQALADLGSQNVLALMSDSTNAYMPGHQIMEREIEHDLDKIFQETRGRLIFGMISTNVERLGQLISCAEKHGRRAFIGGLSLKTTFEIAQQLGYLTPKPQTIIGIEELNHLPAHKIMAIFPGAQGETNGAFAKLADGTQRDTHIQPGDTVVFSSSVIPGNERSVQFVTDKFWHRGAHVINYKMLDIHSGGHARQDDLKEVVKLVKPKYLIPIEGHHAFLHYHAAAAKSTGFPAENIFIARNAQVMEFNRSRQGTLTQEFLPHQNIFIKGSQINQIDEDTLRERRQIAEEGALIIQYQPSSSRNTAIIVESQGIKKASLQAAFHQSVRSFVTEILHRSPHKNLKQQIQSFLEKTHGIHPHLYLISLSQKYATSHAKNPNTSHHHHHHPLSPARKQA